MVKWLVTTSQYNWKRSLERHKLGFNNECESKVTQIKTGDDLLVLISSTGNKIRIAGILKAMSQYFEADSFVRSKKTSYPYFVTTEIIKKPFIFDALTFFQKYMSTKYGDYHTYFGQPIKRISKHEFSAFESEIDWHLSEDEHKKIQDKERKANIESFSRAFPIDCNQKLVCNAKDELRQMLSKFPYKEYPEFIDNLLPQDIVQKKDGFLNLFKRKIGGIEHMNANHIGWAIENIEAFKRLLKIATDLSKGIAEKIDESLDLELITTSGDKFVKGKLPLGLIYLFNSDNLLPIFSIPDMEHFLHRLGGKYNNQDEADKYYEKNYFDLPTGQKYELLTRLLLKAKNKLNRNWDNYAYRLFLYEHVKVEEDPTILVSTKLLIKSKDNDCFECHFKSLESQADKSKVIRNARVIFYQNDGEKLKFYGYARIRSVRRKKTGTTIVELEDYTELSNPKSTSRKIENEIKSSYGFRERSDIITISKHIFDLIMNDKEIYRSDSEELEHFLVKAIKSDNKEIIEQNIFTAEQERLVLTRKGQNAIRRATLERYSNQCAVCDVKESSMLEASHIRPWSKDILNRGIMSNLICFCVTHHALFDHHKLILLNDNRVKFSQQFLNECKNCRAYESYRKITEHRLRLPSGGLPNKQFLQIPALSKH
jgi:putative restriction endonuclease